LLPLLLPPLLLLPLLEERTVREHRAVAQQQRVEELGEERLFATAADAARLLARRAVARYDRAHKP
jgi:hypothetical protein